MLSNYFSVFSFSRLSACENLMPERTPGTIVARLPDSHQPPNHCKKSNIIARYGSHDARSSPPYYHGVVVCYDYQTIEAITLGMDADKKTFALLLATSVPGFSSITAISTATIVLDLVLDKEYIVRACRLTNMSWCRRLWALASRANLVAFTGVYYGVLGGAYSSLSKANASYAYKAGSLAIRQIKLAQWLKDPVLESKCWLYFAEDLIQLGRLKRANKIIARQARFAEAQQNGILLAMVESVRVKWHSGKR
ncbi:hypothetical protein BX666DRAFT_137714 [Dichotomocladium elegans]|nr:hypothetical protein BX666DRAFT_137714 [Dichotomocladium elegans]